jgi:hypothetical protein
VSGISGLRLSYRVSLDAFCGPRERLLLVFFGSATRAVDGCTRSNR